MEARAIRLEKKSLNMDDDCAKARANRPTFYMLVILGFCHTKKVLGGLVKLCWVSQLWLDLTTS